MNTTMPVTAFACQWSKGTKQRTDTVRVAHTTNEQGNANKNYSEIPPHTGPNGYPQKCPQTTNAGECVERREPS